VNTTTTEEPTNTATEAPSSHEETSTETPASQEEAPEIEPTASDEEQSQNTG